MVTIKEEEDTESSKDEISDKMSDRSTSIQSKSMFSENSENLKKHEFGWLQMADDSG